MPAWVIALLLLLVPPVGSAGAQPKQPIQPLDTIRNAARAHLLQQHADEPQVAIQVDQLDRRLRLKLCSEPLQTHTKAGSGRSFRQTVGVSCNGKSPWSLYVPVTVSLKKRILVATRELPRGSLLTAGDLRLEWRDVSRLRRGYLEDLALATGQRLERDLHQDDPLTPRMVTAPRSIKRGARVTILGQVGQIQVRMPGKALADGSVGDRIRVQNQSSKRNIEATVVAAGLVQVTL